jgi:hypothetical protein
MNPVITNAADLDFERGGPADRLLHRLNLVPRCVVLAVIAWLPLLILSGLQVQALGPTPRLSCLLDFATYARFFVALPLLLVAEVFVGPRLRRAALMFVDSKLVQEKDYPAYECAINRVKRRWDAAWPEVIILGIALVGPWTLTIERLSGGVVTWHSGQSLVSWWYHGVSIPILHFLILRWVWRLMIWTRFLWAMSRLDLNVVGTHADGAGGLGFLGNTHGSFGVFAFAINSVLCADAGFQILYEGAKIRDFEVPFFALIIVGEFILLGPLLVFMPLLVRKSREWRRSYSILVADYNRAFDEKWVRGPQPADERLLGSPDIQSLADMGNNFDRIRQMRFIPFSQRAVLQLAAMAALPALPLLSLVVPVAEIFKALAKVVF